NAVKYEMNTGMQINCMTIRFLGIISFLTRPYTIAANVVKM
ncbi:MAG: hypothetical protein ACI8SE_001356, partial [Bacteroidia bacterium]